MVFIVGNQYEVIDKEDGSVQMTNELPESWSSSWWVNEKKLARYFSKLNTCVRTIEVY